MEQRKMSKEEEINDSLEVCRDIYIYYERGEANGTEGQTSSHTSLYAAAYAAKNESRQSQVIPIRREPVKQEKREQIPFKEPKKTEQTEKKAEQEQRRAEKKEEKKTEQKRVEKKEPKRAEQKQAEKKEDKKEENESGKAEKRTPLSSEYKPKRKNWFKLELDPDPEWNELEETAAAEETEPEEPELEEAEPEKVSSILRNIASLFFCVLIAFTAAKLLNEYIIQPTQVEGISMEDSLHNGEHLLMDKLSYRFHDPERFDIVIFPFEEGVYYIKRIIGLPGETIQIKDGQVYIDGALLEEDVYGNTMIQNAGRAAEEVVLGEDEYFLLGDNRDNSFDSRYEVVGNIKKEQFIGKAFFRLYPFDQIGFLGKGKKKEEEPKND